MENSNSEQLYCSVDLEFTGFDPSRDQILEIGFAFFKLSKNGYEVVEEWSQVFKPSIEVHPKILGLTGITQEELDNAPQFNEHRDFLQQKLGDAIIVGHNPVMDVKFLESYGIKLSGKVVDTLELVQFILPTHHSYNLENLVHYFGVKHHKAHRALGDALSTILVLENLVQMYQQFSSDLQSELNGVMNKEEFTWQTLLLFPLDKKDVQKNDSLKLNDSEKQLEPLKLSEQQITVDNIAVNHEVRVALGLAKENKLSLLAVPDSGTVMNLWKNKYAYGVFRSEDTFSKKAFDRFLQIAKTRDELRFAMKVIVWLHTNWQTEAVLDLNISFFGGQFRQFIVGGNAEIKSEKVVVVDYQTLLALAESTAKISDRKLVVTDILNFEKFISAGFGTRLSWNNVLYSLRIIYNPETDFGNLELKVEVTNALVATDLFFGLVYILLHQNIPGSDYVPMQQLSESYEHILHRLGQAANNLKTKILPIAEKVQSGELLRVAHFLENFFTIEEGFVKWIQVDEHNSSFHNQPIDISENVKSLTHEFESVKYTETLTSKDLLFYLVDRLGLNTDKSEIPKNLTTNTLEIKYIEDDLDKEKTYDYLISSPLPLVMVMQYPADVKDFYNNYYEEIKKNAALFAQGYSGGGNKMFRNFSIKENSVLLVTADFMGKQNYLISAKNVIFCGLPAVETAHPYVAALIEHWKHKHPSLQDVFAFQKIVSALKKIKMDSKIVVKIYNKHKNFSFWG